MSKEKKILILGACTNIKNPEKTGGTIVLFENLKKEFDNLNIEYHLIDTNKSNYKNIPLAFISIIKDIFKLGRTSSHISLHGTSKDYLYIAIFVLIASKIYGIEYSLRKFAGDFDIYYESLSPISKMVIRYILKKSKHNFFETKNLTKYFSKFNPNTDWFPNVRELKDRVHSTKKYSKKFVFISQLYKTKGVDEILQASNMLPDEYQIDIFGPIKDDKYSDDYFKDFKANYLGALKSDKVLSKLKEYDFLLLPTYYEGEGYPGIILEAFSIGVPVITTNWRSIPELATDKTGIIIDCKNADSLRDAILSVNNNNYQWYSKNAFETFNKFDSKAQTKKFLETIGEASLNKSYNSKGILFSARPV